MVVAIVGMSHRKRVGNEGLIIVVMGVAGAGKSTLGKVLADALDWPFIEGDDFHPAANVAKMARGEALDDDDRAPWVAALHARIAEVAARSGNAVVACSALRASYRDRLADGVGDVRLVFLSGAPETIAGRIRGRRAHFMPPSLLESQLAAMEPPEGAIRVPIEIPTEEQAERVLRTIRRTIRGDACP